MGRCNPITKTCTRTPWWREAMGIDFYGGSSGGGGTPDLWILATGEWNDSGEWQDDDVWID